MKTAVITGGCGFMGHHLVEHILKHRDWRIVILDKLTYASKGYDRLRDIEVYPENQERVRLFPVDLQKPISEGVDKEIGQIDYIFNLASESHVDNSITSPKEFRENNHRIAENISEYARRHPELEMVIQFSTDEVYGVAPDKERWAKEGMEYIKNELHWLAGYPEEMIDKIAKDGFPEFFYHHPSNPYSASKSDQEAIMISDSNTYKIPVITTHTMNLFGERQHPEKYVPKVIRYILDGKTLPIHASKDKKKAGSRYYIHCRNVADALLHLVDLGYHGYDEWNIAGLEEIDNLTLAKMIEKFTNEWLKEKGLPEKKLLYEMVDFHSSRAGHDLRYALSSLKLLLSGYKYPKDLRESLRKTVRWMLERKEEWLTFQE